MSRVWNPPNRFDPVEITWDEPPPTAELELIEDDSQDVLSHNDSPDLGFSWSVNPYRGCTHACAYCYARPYHEYLGMGAGSDFERKIVVKRRAAELLAAAFARRSWKGELVSFSGVTDCYQPLERRFGLTRDCLAVCADHLNPVSIITRSPLVTRDLDLLGALAAHGAAAVTFSIPIGDREVQKRIEPGAPPPEARLAAMRALSEAGIPVGLSLGPILPGLSDAGIPDVLERARDAGAAWVWAGLVRLPGAVAVVFEQRLREAMPNRADGVLARIRRMRGGSLNDGRFGHRMTGPAEDAGWATIDQLLTVWKRRLGYADRWIGPTPSPFRRPTPQLGLFG
ncbi:MAG: radical SAM protein [Myxococcota bacterium]